MALITGKGFYMWKVPNCEKGDPARIAYTAYRAGLSHVLIKIANGIYDYNYDIATKKDLVAPVANELLKYNIQTWGWHYVYGDLPKREAATAIRQINKIPLAGYVIDAEAEYKGKYTPCRIFMSELRNALPTFPMALSSYRYPKYHNNLPWTDFLSNCQINMPQVYWEQSHNPGDQLARCLNEFQTLVTPQKLIVPTGATYGANHWTPTSEDVVEFLNKAVELGLSGANFWSWDYCRNGLPHLWDVVASFEWPDHPNPPRDIVEKLFDSINSRNIANILDYYQPDAVHINPERTIQGLESLDNWYSDLLNVQFPTSEFKLLETSGDDPSRFFKWEAKHSSGKVYIGSDTLGLSNGKIIYHYSYAEPKK